MGRSCGSEEFVKHLYTDRLQQSTQPEEVRSQTLPWLSTCGDDTVILNKLFSSLAHRSTKPKTPM